VKPAFNQLAAFFINYIRPPFIKRSVLFFFEWISYKDLLQPLLVDLLPKLHQNLKLTDEDLMNIMPDDNFRYSKANETPENYT